MKAKGDKLEPEIINLMVFSFIFIIFQYICLYSQLSLKSHINMTRARNGSKKLFSPFYVLRKFN